MSYKIYYDKAFIKLKNGIIPMVCSGDSEIWTLSDYGMKVPERNWHILESSCALKLIFSESEIEQIADNMEHLAAENGIHKSRFKLFSKGEFKRWIMSGIESACSIEEYIRLGNVLMLSVQNDALKLPIDTESDLKRLLQTYASDATLFLKFMGRDLIKPVGVKTKETKKVNGNPHFYVICGNGFYVVKLTAERVWFSKNANDAKRFTTQECAERYLIKHANKFAHCEHKVVCINKGGV